MDLINFFDFSPGSQKIKDVQTKIDNIDDFCNEYNEQSKTLSFTTWKDQLDSLNEQIEWLEFIISISNNTENNDI